MQDRFFVCCPRDGATGSSRRRGGDPKPTPDPDGKPADLSNPVKVFILLGQSNMLGFGHIMGHLHEEPVFILKACIGNRSLEWDLLPPGSERYEFKGNVRTIDARPFWRDREVSPSGQGYHYNHNA